MSQNNVVIALLDKAWPPQHSFVDGMLTDVAAQEADLKIRLCVSRVSKNDLQPRPYRGVACIPGLHPRRGGGRLKNLWAALWLIHYQARREKQRGNRVVLFVRNDPIYLLAALLVRSRVDRLVFQSSFPHEEFSGHAVKRRIARMLYRIAGRGVDVVTGVSPEGVARAQRLCPSAMAGGHIPLLADFPPASQNRNERTCPKGGPIFVYIGTHNTGRELPTVMAGIVRAVAKGAVAQFRFVGATEADENRLRQVEGVDGLIARGILYLERPVPRQEIPLILSNCDVGVSLIPPRPVYYESSPTKLAEYMGAGLAVLASNGIPMQERFVSESRSGILVAWGEDTIAEGICILSKDFEAIKKYGENAAFFSTRSLQYRFYISGFRQLLGV
ncbi:glycosyltransferase [Pseudomonas sp. MYb185]|uniref:glycosyltransferase n=1 Tax=Pseudomonas sp. MYb185 TaxID=1848729 RepID=UPI000CFAE86C|nr:glycosyltransferase [Pseudomonas sp. MYb185]PRB75439.1 hypothetical protein CQ007_17935 [Pseudomonas sp. MYb185]